MQRTSDINIAEIRPLSSPNELVAKYPRSEKQAALVVQAREAIRGILLGKDPRFLVIVGPCSIHDPEAGIEYGQRLAALARELEDRLVIAMRVYFEKPRTAIGWKGLILDPKLDGSCDIQLGLSLARRVLGDILDLGLPTATEFLDPITPQYIADLVCWGAIGARTTESQTHRQLASGLSMPVGFKNATDGSVQPAINAIKAASQRQTFLGITSDGRAASVRTSGNPDCHVVLRGGASGPNSDSDSIAKAAALASAVAQLRPIVVDCSHDNSGKDPERQPEIFRDILEQFIPAPRSPIAGVMLESNLLAGNQPFPCPKEKLRRGVSITDGCIDWETTEALLREAHQKLGARAVR